MVEDDARRALATMKDGEKQELLFSKFGVNYNTTPEMFRKGSFQICVGRSMAPERGGAEQMEDVASTRPQVAVEAREYHVDLSRFLAETAPWSQLLADAQLE
jgi:tRNA(His) 5'-end guanylyltransferase